MCTPLNKIINEKFWNSLEQYLHCVIQCYIVGAIERLALHFPILRRCQELRFLCLSLFFFLFCLNDHFSLFLCFTLGLLYFYFSSSLFPYFCLPAFRCFHFGFTFFLYFLSLLICVNSLQFSLRYLILSQVCCFFFRMIFGLVFPVSSCHYAPQPS